MNRYFVVFCITMHLTCVLVYAQENESTLTIAATLPLKAEGNEIKQGIDSAFRACNATKCLKDTTLAIDAHDDKKSIARSVRLITKIHQESPIIMNVFTSGALQSVLHLVKDKKLLIFAPQENSDELYKQELSHILHTKPPISHEIRLLIDYSIRYLNKLKFAILYEDSTLGVTGYTYAKKIIEEYKSKMGNESIRLVASASHPRDTVEVQHAAQKIAPEFPETIICISRRHATYNFILKVMNMGLMRTAFLGTSYLLAIQEALNKARGINFITTSYTPDLNADKPYKIVESYKEHLKQFVPGEYPNPISLSAYINARILITLVKKCSSPITPSKIVSQAKTLDKYDLEGLTLSYQEKMPAITYQLWISPGYHKPYKVWQPYTPDKPSRDTKEKAHE